MSTWKGPGWSFPGLTCLQVQHGISKVGAQRVKKGYALQPSEEWHHLSAGNFNLHLQTYQGCAKALGVSHPLPSDSASISISTMLKSFTNGGDS